MILNGSRDGTKRYTKPAKRLFQAFALWYKNRENVCLCSYCAIQRGVCSHFQNHGWSRDKNWVATQTVADSYDRAHAAPHAKKSQQSRQLFGDY